MAVIATARKLVTIAYLMLKNNEPYRYAKLSVVKNKLNECRRKAHSLAAKGNTASQQTIEPSPLNALYRQHQIPLSQTPQEWSSGERRALAEAEVTPFVESVHQIPLSKPRRGRPKVAT